jgi:hypothetical protein
MSSGRVVDVPAIGREADDIDTWEDVARLHGDDPPGVPRSQT